MGELLVEHGENTLIVSEFGYPTDIFQLVDEVPYGFFVWNIGKHMPKGYLPLCRLSYRQPFPGGRNIDADSLKAIKIDGSEIILDAVGAGQNTMQEMELFLERYKNAKPGTWNYIQIKRIKAALPIMKKIKWNS